MLQYRLYGGAALPAGLQGFVKAGANIGSVIGQFAFGQSTSCLVLKLKLTVVHRFLCRLLWSKSSL